MPCALEKLGRICPARGNLFRFSALGQSGQSGPHRRRYRVRQRLHAHGPISAICFSSFLVFFARCTLLCVLFPTGSSTYLSGIQLAEFTNSTSWRTRMSLRTAPLFAFGTAFILLQPASAQVTYGKKPQLPPPFATKSAGNGPSGVRPAKGFLPTVPPGFQVNVFAQEFKYVRFLTTAPNGDIFAADTGSGEVIVLRDPQHTGGASQREVFVYSLKRSFGIAFHDDYVYVSNTGEVVRFRYDKQTSKRLGEAEHVLDLPRYGGHSPRTLAFSKDGQHLYVSVGSSGNIDIEKDQRRGAILVCDPDGKNARIFASGLRNSVGLAVEPATGAVWGPVNERDELGDDLPPHHLTSVKHAAFYPCPPTHLPAHR